MRIEAPGAEAPNHAYTPRALSKPLPAAHGFAPVQAAGDKGGV